MYRELGELILYSDLDRHELLTQLGQICRELDEGRTDRDLLRARLFRQLKRLLDLSTQYGFDGNLWQNYLTFVMVSHPHSFGLAAEGTELGEGTIHRIALHDFGVFRRLFHYDFSLLEEALNVDCFSIVTDYQAMVKREQLFNSDVSGCIRLLSMQIAHADSDEEVFFLMADHYRMYGMGLFGMNRAFRVKKDKALSFVPILNVDQVLLSDLVGYEAQKAELRQNVERFLNGSPYNNMLLYGDAGTGKSTCVKACLNEYWQEGLRIIELNKYQFDLLSDVISLVKLRRYRFMILLDDLSFEKDEAEYKYLKAVIEGGLETRPDNVMIVATSNRRHLIREGFSDRADMEYSDDLHKSDTVEEKLSLSARFGCAIRFSAPDRKLFNEMCLTLARKQTDTTLSDEQLLKQAAQFELRHGGLSGRTAQQFVNTLVNTEEE